MTPIWASTISGSTPSTVNTAASRMPALVMTPPVTASATEIAVVVSACSASSLARVVRKML